MLRSIHCNLVRRLLTVAVILSLLGGAVVVLLEMREIDRYVLDLAMEESNSLMEHVAFLTVRDKGEFERLRAEVEEHVIAEHLYKGKFILIELYDLHGKPVISVADPDFEAVAKSIEQLSHDIRTYSGIEHHRRYLGGLFYLQVLAPLTYASNETVGHFEGVYRVAPEEMRAIRRSLVLAVLQVMVVIFVTAAAVYPVIIALNRDLIRISNDLTVANMGMLEALGSAVSKRDTDTNIHNYRVTIYAIRLAEALGVRTKKVRGLIKGAFLHDIGKIGIADAILHKPSSLTLDEARTMEYHVQYGVDIIGNYNWLKDALEVVRYHHEKYDGTGYPEGLKGEGIPVAARIFSIVDVFDAVTSERPYKTPATLANALKVLKRSSGTDFDPELLNVFEKIAPDLYREVSKADEEQLTTMLDELLKKYFHDRTDITRTIVSSALMREEMKRKK